MSQPADLAEEIKRLQRCINDLVSLLALPAMWSGGDPSQIIHTLLDALLRMLQLDLVYVRLKDRAVRRPSRLSGSLNRKNNSPAARDRRSTQTLAGGRPSGMASADTESYWRRRPFDSPIGTGAAWRDWRNCSRVGASGFPAANRETYSERSRESGIHRAARGAAPKRTEASVASELDRRVAQRTAELAAANQELRKEIGERKRAEEDLRSNEEKHRLVVETASDAVISMDDNGTINSPTPQPR